MSSDSYWLSASVLTITSAPRARHSLSPRSKARARPWWVTSCTTWSTPHSRAISGVRSVLPSSTTKVSITSTPGSVLGREAKVTGRVASSFQQGI
jgi:hypothetical protein